MDDEQIASREEIAGEMEQLWEFADRGRVDAELGSVGGTGGKAVAGRDRLRRAGALDRALCSHLTQTRWVHI